MAQGRESKFSLKNKRSHASFDDIPIVQNSMTSLVLRAKKILKARQVAKENVEMERLAQESVQSKEAIGSIAWLNDRIRARQSIRAE